MDYLDLILTVAALVIGVISDRAWKRFYEGWKCGDTQETL